MDNTIYISMFPKHINGITKKIIDSNPSIKENKIENDNKDIKKIKM